jgi:phosphatidylinositol glycan class V
VGAKSLLVSSSKRPTILLIPTRNLGFLRYWTISNMPLFLLAAPMLFILIQSAVWTWRSPLATIDATDPSKAHPDIRKLQRDAVDRYSAMRRIALPQLLLAILALTNYHVQIITRLSSAYPVWYWWLACSMISSGSQEQRSGKCTKPWLVSRWMVMYALVQGGLFASFLPPA